MRAICKNGKYYAFGRVVNGDIVFNQFDRYSSKPKHYLPFQSDTPFTLNTKNNSKNWNGILEYSTDTTTWSEWNGTSISSSSDGLLCLRGAGNTVITGDYDKGFVFNDASNLRALGNIENLLDWETVKNGEHPPMSDFCYCAMFYGCTSLITPPELPATTLADECYRSMLSRCTSLTTPPELPAINLAYKCYAFMLSRCTSLTTPPELPALTLADFCYQGMLQSCTSLTSAPELPATTLVDFCYWAMFYGCTSLLSPPELLATTLAEGCYREMFMNCTSLTTPPELLATTLATQCYYMMFRSCTSLITPPELPALTLTEGCYYHMFMNCTSLTRVPELPATTLAEVCYEGMFSGCTLIKISETKLKKYKYEWRIPTTGEILEEPTNWNYEMLRNTKGKFKGEPQINTTYYTINPPVATTPAPMNMSRVAMFGIEPNQCNDDENIKILNEMGVETI